MKGTTVCRGTVAIAVVAALTGAAGCTSSDAPGDTDRGGRASGKVTTHPAVATALRAAESSTDRADSARVRSTTTMGSALSMTADGVLGWRDGTTGTVTITYTSGTTADLMRRLGTTSMEARYLPDAYYARMGEKFAERAGGRHWIRYRYADLADLGGASGADLRNQMRATTPNQSVKLLLASGGVEKVGVETVRGERTTHYAGTVHVADLASTALRKQLAQAGVSTETVDIWVNDRDLLVKKVEKGTTSAGRYTQTAYYGDYGAKVSAAEPPASDTEDVKDLLRNQVLTPGGDTSPG
ncbi:hypothetical protein ABT052_05580 [Streptomyces sp. NPDC002766]|uniref:hypothetical protein n=1 Tax=unclassified Streptomyces TaxID=2593676 RepID=UPI00331823CF